MRDTNSLSLLPRYAASDLALIEITSDESGDYEEERSKRIKAFLIGVVGCFESARSIRKITNTDAARYNPSEAKTKPYGGLPICASEVLPPASRTSATSPLPSRALVCMQRLFWFGA